MQPDDPFGSISAERYVAYLTGREHERGFFRCPFHGNGDERTPSLNTNGVLWYCHGRGKGGSIYDFGAELWGIKPRGKGFAEIRTRLGRELLTLAGEL